MSDQRTARAELFAKLPTDALRKARNEAASRGDLDLANDALAALNLRAVSQTPEIEHAGELYEHVHEPSRANGWRGSVTYTGDNIAWMAPMMTGGQVGRINRDAAVVARQTVDLKAGERVQIVKADGTARSA
ncbi:MAG: hypothetical protein ACREEL_00100 [Stellaceae bacterium]